MDINEIFHITKLDEFTNDIIEPVCCTMKKECFFTRMRVLKIQPE
ncbi:hypothetical protein ACFWDG_21700 [Peribacillus sp. NPDC060186]